MENILLAAKFVVFLVIQLFVFSAVGAVLIACVYQIVRDKVRESRRQDEIAPETGSLPPTGRTVPHHS